MSVTAKQIAREFKKSRRTISRYTALGLIPAPLTVPTGKRGTGAVWPDYIRKVFREIDARLAAGKTLEQIAADDLAASSVNIQTGTNAAQQLLAAWDVPRLAWPKTSTAFLLALSLGKLDSDREDDEDWAPTGQPPTAREAFKHLLFERCAEITENPDLARRIADKAPSTLPFAISLFLAGYSPVLMWFSNLAAPDGPPDECVHVTPGFMVGHDVNELDALSLIKRVKFDEPDPEQEMIGRNRLSTYWANRPRLIVPLSGLIDESGEFADTTSDLLFFSRPFFVPNREIHQIYPKENFSIGYNYRLLPGHGYPHGQALFEIQKNTARVTYVGDPVGESTSTTTPAAPASSRTARRKTKTKAKKK